MEEANKDYFELKYLEEISQLFNRLKGMNNYYKLNLFNTQNYTEFFDFIQNHVIICENVNDESDDDIYGDNNIYGKF